MVRDAGSEPIQYGGATGTVRRCRLSLSGDDMADEDAREQQDGDEQAVEAERIFVTGAEQNALSKLDDALPDTVIALPMNQRPVFPTMMLPLMIPAGPLAEAARKAIDAQGGHVGFFLTAEPLENQEEYRFEDLHPVGAIARILKHQSADEGGLQIFAQVLARFEIERAVATDPVVLVSGRVVRPRVDADRQEIRALAMGIVTALKDLVQHNPVFADEIRMVLANYNNIDGPGRLADLAASLTTAKRDELQDVLATYDIQQRMEKVLVLLAKETELAELKSKIQNQINEKVSEHQRRFFLNEQLKAIKEELGLETDEKSLELERFRTAYEERKEAILPEVRDTIEEELRKLSLLEPSSSEYGVSRNRLEWLVGMPWGEHSEDLLQPERMRAGLDDDHHGMDEVKDRIVEFCAVRALKQDRGGGIIALAGPPGTGKTSIGASIARHLGRSFYRFSLGGMRDEAEIKGHRRTYVGALPGKIAQALRHCKTMNPVILLDEVDKLSHGLQGDPAAALLEVLDPEQNSQFLDHYLDVRLDLSRVLFVCTANDLGGIPEPLRDRMEIIRLPGYVETEKVAIGSRYLLPKQREAHGLKTSDIVLNKSAFTGLVRGYAREAGVRQLEQLIAKICRKVATEKARILEQQGAAGSPERGGKKRGQKQRRQEQQDASWQQVRISSDDLPRYLGKPFMSDDELMVTAVPGVVTGLAWTSMGGATLEIEAVAVPVEPGKGGFQLSGQLGDVMKESAHLARTWLRAQATELGVPEDWFDRMLIHLHVPAGATPKDGPSAGITMATAMLSLALGKPTRRKLGMTGELTLTGRVYPIGGVREKLVAARRAGLKTIVLPAANERDVAELPGHITKGLDLVYAKELRTVLETARLIRPQQ
ncbi:MAG: endopeptidase La [Planctomycetota bacterium]